MFTPEQIRSMIENALPGCRVEVRDATGTSNHFQVIVVSKEFEGKGLIEQHQLVYSSLGDAMKEKIHALQLKTMTPEAYEHLK